MYFFQISILFHEIWSISWNLLRSMYRESRKESQAFLEQKTTCFVYQIKQSIARRERRRVMIFK